MDALNANVAMTNLTQIQECVHAYKVIQMYVGAKTICVEHSHPHRYFASSFQPHCEQDNIVTLLCGSTALLQ